MATLLETVQDFCRPRKIPVPMLVFGSTDTQIAQIYGLLQEGCERLADRGAWERLVIEATWVTLAQEDQGAMTTIAPNGFRNWYVPGTFWDRTQKLPLLGPRSAQAWQMLKATVLTGPVYSFRTRGGRLLVSPVPVAGHTWAFEYISENWILKVDGVTYAKKFTADDNSILLPDAVVRSDLLWRWKKEKGLAYAEDFNESEKLIVNALGRDGGKPNLSLDSCGNREPTPGIIVPAGNWLQP